MNLLVLIRCVVQNPTILYFIEENCALLRTLLMINSALLRTTVLGVSYET